MKQQVKQDPIAVEKLSIKHHRYGPKPRTVRWAKRRLSRQRRHESNRFMQEVWQEQDQDAILDAAYFDEWETTPFEWDDWYAAHDEQERLDDSRWYFEDDYDDHGCGYAGCSYCDPDPDEYDEPRRESQAKRDLHDSIDAARALIRAYESKEIWYSYHDECLVHDGRMPYDLWSACTAFRLEVKELR